MIRRDWGPVRREFKSQSRNGINIESTLLHPLKRKRGGGKKKGSKPYGNDPLVINLVEFLWIDNVCGEIPSVQRNIW